MTTASPQPKAGKSFFARLIRSRRGATALEFSLLAAPVIAFSSAALQAGIIYMFDGALQSVAQTAARTIMTGKTQDAALTPSQFFNKVCGYTGGEFGGASCSGMMVDVQSASSFSGLSTTPITITYDGSGNPTNTWSFNPGSPGNAVIMRVMYDWPVVGGPFAFGLANQSNGSHLMVATVVFQNEPYQ